SCRLICAGCRLRHEPAGGDGRERDPVPAHEPGALSSPRLPVPGSARETWPTAHAGSGRHGTHIREIARGVCVPRKAEKTRARPLNVAGAGAVEWRECSRVFPSGCRNVPAYTISHMCMYSEESSSRARGLSTNDQCGETESVEPYE